jgi:hypothetical protein
LTKAQLWNKDDGPFTNYWFYSNGNNCLVVVEVVPNVFTHWCFGVLDKFSTWTGGEFLAGINMGSPGWSQTSGEWLIGTTAFSSYGSYPFCYDQGNASAYGAVICIIHKIHTATTAILLLWRAQTLTAKVVYRSQHITLETRRHKIISVAFYRTIAQTLLTVAPYLFLFGVLFMIHPRPVV